MTEKTIQIPKNSNKLNDKTYLPKSITIKKNDTITWSNNEDPENAHTVTSGSPETGPDGKFDSAIIMGGETYSFTFEELGTFDYFCNCHPWKKGQIIVM